MSSEPAHLKAVVFDYGAVLCNLPTDRDLDKFSAAARMQRDEFWRLYLDTRAPYDRGSLDARGYWQYFGERAGRVYSEDEVRRLAAFDISVWRGMNEDMLNLARQVRDAGLRTALLSNMPADLMYAIRAEDSWLDLFEKHFFSCEIGSVKPEPEIYRHVVDRLDISPSEALLIDDNPANVSSAKKFGLRALLFHSLPALLPQLSAELNGRAKSIPALNRA